MTLHQNGANILSVACSLAGELTAPSSKKTQQPQSHLSSKVLYAIILVPLLPIASSHLIWWYALPRLLRDIFPLGNVSYGSQLIITTLSSHMSASCCFLLSPRRCSLFLRPNTGFSDHTNTMGNQGQVSMSWRKMKWSCRTLTCTNPQASIFCPLYFDPRLLGYTRC